MTDTNNQTTSTNETKAKTVRDDFPKVSFFATASLAAAFLARMQSEITDLSDVDMVAVGLTMNDAGELVFDPAKYDGNEVMICKVDERLGSGNVKTRAIQISPTPTIEALLADEHGKAWVAKKVRTALNAEAVRPIRKVDADKKFVYQLGSDEMIAAIPCTLEDFVTSAERGSSLLEAYEELWSEIRKFIGERSTAFRNRGINKKQFRLSMSSAAYASRMFPELETTKSGVSVFVFAINAFKTVAETRGYDTQIFDDWLAKRNEAVIDEDDDEEEAELSLDGIGSLLAAPAPNTEGEAAAS